MALSLTLSRFYLQLICFQRFCPGSPAIPMIPEDRAGRGISSKTSSALALSLTVATLFLLPSAWAQTTIDSEKSVMTVHVFKAGLFSAFGHEHEVRAPIQQGVFNETTPSVELA